jgi:heme-degrading monooxygenase HmoA
MAEPCRWVTWHFLRFPEIRTPDMLDLTRRPSGAAGWEIGIDSPPRPDGSREPSGVWCALGLYRERAKADRAVAEPGAFLPFLAETTEAWHAMLMPVAHRGECNHLEREAPGAVLEAHGEDPGGPLLVMTTGGYVIGPGFDRSRAIDFAHRSAKVREVVRVADGNLGQQVFYPHEAGGDPVTMTVWRSDAAMSAFAYRAGLHREMIERHKRIGMLDRTSFTRLRAVRTVGRWEGRNPIAAALGSPLA